MEPYLGQIQAFSFSFVPRGWAKCDGSLLQISENAALYSLLGTKFGGDGVSTFALPDLCGRVMVSPNKNTYVTGATGGATGVKLSTNTLPAHTHAMLAISSDATSAVATDSIPATVSDVGSGTIPVYRSYSEDDRLELNSGMVSSTGGGEAHNNMQPYAVVGYCIATSGLYPTRT